MRGDETGDAKAGLRSLGDVVGELDRSLRAGAARRLLAVPTGFQPLDHALGGGVRPGDLVLLGGAPGVGKTIAALQWARNVAAAGGTAVYACFEHEEADLTLRLLALEMGSLPDASAAGMDALRSRILAAAGAGGSGLADLLDAGTGARLAFERMEEYADRLWLVRASGAHTGVEELEALVAERRPTVAFVDYLQKVAVRPEPPTEAEKVTRIAEQLKDLALAHQIPVVCVVASDQAGIRSPRLRLHHFRGSAALAFEADVAIVLNEKFSCVSKVHLAYDPVRASTFRGWVVFSVEKNRGGPNLVDLEHRKDFGALPFRPRRGTRGRAAGGRAPGPRRALRTTLGPGLGAFSVPGSTVLVLCGTRNAFDF